MQKLQILFLKFNYWRALQQFAQMSGKTMILAFIFSVILTADIPAHLRLSVGECHATTTHLH